MLKRAPGAPEVQLYRPVRSKAGVAGGLAFGVALLVALAALWQAAARPPDLAAFFLVLIGVAALGAASAAALWTFGWMTLRYELQRGGCVVRCLGRGEVIPYQRIEAVYSGDRLERVRLPRGLNNWPGYRVGRGWARNLGVVNFYVTSDDRGEMVVVVTDTSAYALTPSDSVGFRQALIARAEADQEVEPPVISPGWVGLLLTLRGAGELIPLAAAAGMLMVGAALVADRYQALPTMLALTSESLGRPGLMVPKSALLALPAAGAGLLAINFGLGLRLRRPEPFAAGLLWHFTPLVEAGLLVALLRLLQL